MTLAGRCPGESRRTRNRSFPTGAARIEHGHSAEARQRGREALLNPYRSTTGKTITGSQTDDLCIQRLDDLGDCRVLAASRGSSPFRTASGSGLESWPESFLIGIFGQRVGDSSDDVVVDALHIGDRGRIRSGDEICSPHRYRWSKFTVLLKSFERIIVDLDVETSRSGIDGCKKPNLGAVDDRRFSARNDARVVNVEVDHPGIETGKGATGPKL